MENVETLDEDHESKDGRNRQRVYARMKHLLFMKQLEENGYMAAFARATRGIPEDPSGGMRVVELRLGIGDWTKIAKTVVLILRILFNLAVNLSTLSLLWKSQMSLTDSSGISVTYNVTDVTLCTQQDNCESLPIHRFVAYKLDILFSCVIGAPLALISLMFIAMYLVSSPPKAEFQWPPQILPESGWDSLPYRRPWFFTFAPRLASGFSSIIFINFLSPTVISNLLVRGDGDFWMSLVRSSVFPTSGIDAYRRKMNEHLGVTEREDSTSHTVWKIAKKVIAACFFFALLAFSLQSFVIKITNSYFVLASDARAWTYMSWFRFVGFVNQLVASYQIYDPEFQRLLLFVFAGSDCKLQGKDIVTANMYLRLFALKIVDFHSFRFKDRMATVSALINLSADDVQKMLLSPLVEKHMDEQSDDRTTLYKDLNTSDNAEDFYNEMKSAAVTYCQDGQEGEEALQKAKEKRIVALLKMRTELWHQIKDNAHGSSTALLKRLLVIQEYIESVDNLAFAEEDKDELEGFIEEMEECSDLSDDEEVDDADGTNSDAYLSFRRVRSSE